MSTYLAILENVFLNFGGGCDEDISVVKVVFYTYKLRWYRWSNVVWDFFQNNWMVCELCEMKEKVRTGHALIIVTLGWCVDVDSKCYFLHYCASLKFSIIKNFKRWPSGYKL